MKIDLSKIDLENFMTHPHEIAGETCHLVQPVHIGAKFTRDTLIFRSSVWNSQGELISASFKKFFNWGEQPDLCFTPFSLTANGGCELIEKIDGSTLVVSKYNGKTIIRTRGTTDASKIDNGHEIEWLKDKYPNAFKHYDTDGDTSGYSHIFEWVSPVNKIVLNYGEDPDIYLTAIIRHSDYTLSSQLDVDRMATVMGVKRPLRYNFASIKEMREAVEQFKGKEGLCVYCNHGQDIRKVKSAEYLAAHRMKSELGSIERVMELWFTIGKPSYQGFEAYFQKKFDYELFSMCQGHASLICNAWEEVQKIVDYMQKFVDKVRGLSRKDAAVKILSAYGNTNRANFCFSLLDNKSLTNEQLTKLMFQVLKK